MGLFLSSGVLLPVLCSERERPFFVPSPAIRFAERAEGVKPPRQIVGALIQEVRFARDSPLEEAGFELSVPPERKAFPRALDRFRRPSLRAPWEWDVKRRLRGVEFPVALFDVAGALVPGNGGADMIWASALACSGDFLLRLAGCQGKDLIAEGGVCKPSVPRERSGSRQSAAMVHRRAISGGKTSVRRELSEGHPIAATVARAQSDTAHRPLRRALLQRCPVGL